MKSARKTKDTLTDRRIGSKVFPFFFRCVCVFAAVLILCVEDVLLLIEGMMKMGWLLLTVNYLLVVSDLMVFVEACQNREITTVLLKIQCFFQIYCVRYMHVLINLHLKKLRNTFVW